MPRIPRKNCLGQSGTFHIINRGILRQEIFHDQQDVRYFLKVIGRYKEKLSFLIYHWCIMPNHYHLLADFLDDKFLAKFVGACQQIYAAYYHRKYKTAGKLFQGRFKSQVIEREKYLIECGRYIELNPVRAGLVSFPWDWEWSSAGFYCLHKEDLIIAVNEEFKGFYLNTDTYREWLCAGKNITEKDSVFHGSEVIVGSEAFRKKHVMNKGRPVRRARGRPRKVNIND